MFLLIGTENWCIINRYWGELICLVFLKNSLLELGYLSQDRMTFSIHRLNQIFFGDPYYLFIYLSSAPKI